MNTADKELNQVYQKVMAQIAADKIEDLKKKQRQWIQQRDSTCQAKAIDEAGSGSLESVGYTICRTDETSKRTQELKGMLSSNIRRH